MSAFDYIILGTGVAGGVVADNLTRAGKDVLLVEAGRHFRTQDFPLDQMAIHQIYWQNGLEYTRDYRIGLLRGKCVGGSSVVNQALLDEFPDFVWDRWKRKSGIAHFEASLVRASYDKCLQETPHKTMSESERNENARIFVRGMERRGLGWRPLRRAQTDCQRERGHNCIDCLGGCPIDSKQSGLVTTLARALERGATLRSEFTCTRIRPSRDGLLVEGTGPEGPQKLYGKKVILACGARGTPEILLRSGLRSEVKALGRGFYVHPQFCTFGLFPRRIDAHRGAFQTVASDEPSLYERGFKFESIMHPLSTLALLLPVDHGLLPFFDSYERVGCIEVSIRDEEPGCVVRDWLGRTFVDKPVSENDWRKLEEARAIAEDVLRHEGAERIVHSTAASSVHLMGGCSMGTDRRSSVVGEGFQVHGEKNLFVVDSSLFVDAPGCNPSLSVMALADIASEVILAA